MLNKVVLILCIFTCSYSSWAAGPLDRMTGAYRQAKVTDVGVIDAANFAVQTIGQGALVKIVSAMAQVVAGLNYKLELEIVDKDGKHHNYNAVVFVPLPATGLPMQLTSFKNMGIL